MARPRIIVDCDPGHDDAVALVTAAHHADLVGITTVAGNVPLARTTANALAITTLLGVDVPVHAGAARPLVAPPSDASFVHGASGLDGADLPEPDRGVASHDAVAFLVDTIRSEEGLWLVPTGPLTNVALALRQAPDLARRVAGVVLMGGGTHGNRTAAAEYNIWADPEAAAVVLTSGAPITMAGLDVTMQLLMDPGRVAAVRATGTRTGAVVAGLLDHYGAYYRSFYVDIAGPAVHDACAVLAVTHPHLFSGEDVHVVVETSGVHTRGMTLVDRRPTRERAAPNVHFLTGVDDAGATAAILEAVRAAP